MPKLDCLLVNPGSRTAVYQGLAHKFSAIEPPSLAALFATYLLKKGHSVEILDAQALELDADAVERLYETYQPRLVVLVVYGFQPSASTQNMPAAGAIARVLKECRPDCKIMITGTHPAALPERTYAEEAVDYVCSGEGPDAIDRVLNALKGGAEVSAIIGGRNVEDLDSEMPGAAWELLPMNQYRAHNWHAFGLADREPYASIHTTLGCPYKCLRGDTAVNTVRGKVPIRELAESGERVGVYTYDWEEGRVFIADGINAKKYGTQEALVRVHFDDGSHMDCTPDHEFLTFRWSTAEMATIEEPVQAQHLVGATRIRAIREEHHQSGRVYVTWSRRGRSLRARMIVEYREGRRLRAEERVHHDDHNPGNDDPRNLILCANSKEHVAQHPEVSQRMRDNSGRSGTKSRVEVNHVVTHIEWLSDRDDVYCLTVPATGWFFANDVLVKNCNFCCINAPFGGPSYRRWSPLAVGRELEQLVTEHGVRNIKFVDEMFVLNRAHVLGVCEEIMLRDLGDSLNIWAYARVDTVKDEFLAPLRAAGFRWLALGIESASKHVRDGAEKGCFGNEEILRTVKKVQDAGINVIGNYIFGLPDDTHASMEETLSLALAANCEFANFYSAMAYPGSKLYDAAKSRGWALPDDPGGPGWIGYSQHAFETLPLPTDTLSAPEVLRFRDVAFLRYFNSTSYLSMVERKFGPEARAHIILMTQQQLKRKILQ